MLCWSVCVYVCFHARTQALEDWGDSRNAFTVWSNSQACRQIHMSERTPWAFHVKGNVNRWRLSSRAGPAALGREETWTCSVRDVSASASSHPPLHPPLPLRCSLVVHQRLDFVHQLTCYLQDVLDIVTLGHFCGSDTLLERQQAPGSYRHIHTVYTSPASTGWQVHTDKDFSW